MVAQTATAELMYAFNVMWKKKGDRSATAGSYIARSVFDLLRILENAEDVTRLNVETLVVHQHNKNGKTIEVLCIEEGETKALLPTKPHIKVLTEPELPVITGGYTYKAYPAYPQREVV